MIFNGAFNNLSFGAISYGLTNELFLRGIKTSVFPIGGNVDLSAFTNSSQDYRAWLQTAVNSAPSSYKADDKTLKAWHILGAQESIGRNQHLLTFHELDSLTETEVNILNQQKKVFVTSTFSKGVFERCGVTVPVVYAPMGFDRTHYFKDSKTYFDDGTVVISVFGKWEKRKHTEKVIKFLLARFNGDKKYRIHLHTVNPFFKPEQMNALFSQAFGGKSPPFNFQIFGYQPTNAELNQCYNVTDVVVDMSGGESISLPSLTCVALGKHAVIHNCSAMKDWANEENACLVQPSGKESVVDGVFFHPNAPFNQGNLYTWKDEDLSAALDKAIERHGKNKVNEAGFKLQADYSFNTGMEIILKEMF